MLLKRKKKRIECKGQDDFIFVKRRKAVHSYNSIAFNFLTTHFGEYCFNRGTLRKIKALDCNILYYYDQNKLAGDDSLKFSEIYCDSHNYYSSGYK